jgi:predicted RNase H-related nuclease YkuK (DUF458 family)
VKPKIDVEEVKTFIENSSEKSKVYVGTDSFTYRRNNKWYADYISVVVIHKDGKHGCKIFGDVVTEEDFVKDRTRPTLRLMNEAIKTVALYEQIKDSIGSRYREIHLDINTSQEHNSHLALSQAVGYIKGICGLEPKLKPEAVVASCAADRYGRVKNYDIRYSS